MEIYNDILNGILSKGEGLKVLLLDDESKQIISNMLSHSKLLDNDFFLFEMIKNKKRKKMSNISCVVIIRPTSIKELIEEISDPYYDEYIVLSTNYLSEDVISDMAKADVYCVVKEIYEIYIDVYRLDDGLFSVSSGVDENRIIDGIFSFFHSMNTAPMIKVMTGSDSLQNIGEMLSKRLKNINFDQNSELIMIDRRFDMLTPLVYEWRYQAMAYEYLNYTNGIIKIQDKPFSVIDDEFFRAHRFKDINSVTESLTKTIKQLEKMQSQITSHDKKEIPNESIEAHIRIHKAIINECIKNKELSEIEMSIISGNNHHQLGFILKDTSIEYQKRLKLLLIYLIRNSLIEIPLEIKKELHPKCVTEYRKSVQKFFTKYNPGKQTKYNSVINTKVDIKLGYKPAIASIVKDVLINRKRHLKFFKMINNQIPERKNLQDSKKIVFYFHGGMTLSEYRVINEYINQEKNVYVLCDFIVGYKDILKAIE
ncbi:Vacuolar protein sorting-associated protein 45 [Astathelohania contejeani]|uniref:Vacuolar protein sorting-associated protein 45 n=1 Tax=Astathelohania contejeani TaxID=164912 RepID=A0ABQ7HYP4_9MICR|nr:Vacuolar protein sorting-associated protein 45 [Thelohania contejeani]